MTAPDDRYQFQPWYVKLWRRRHYLPIPWYAVSIWWHERSRPLVDPEDWRMTFKQSWGLATGLAQMPMKWYWSWEELENKERT